MRPPVVVVATRNPGKLLEIRTILGAVLRDVRCRLAGLDEFPEVPPIAETGATFRENALLKARVVHTITGLPSLADDSGLEVDFLSGAPGVRSARYAGEDATVETNNRLLLASLLPAGDGERRARFRCVAAFADDGAEWLTEGVCEGGIAFSPGGHGGFGYDPLFVPEGYGVTFGELSPAEKNELSHRGKAFREMGRLLRAHFGGGSADAA